MWTLKLKLYLTFIWDWWIDFCHFPPQPGLSLADLAGQPMRGLIYWGKWLAFIFIYQIKGDCFNILQISGKLCPTWKLCLKLIIWHQLLSTQFNFSVYCKSGRWNFLYYKGIFLYFDSCLPQTALIRVYAVSMGATTDVLKRRRRRRMRRNKKLP